MNAYLASIPQWIVVMLVWNPAKNKWDKLPCDFRTGMPADAHQSNVWTTHDQARAAAAQWGQGYTVGFVLTVHDDLFCLDIDGARQTDGSWSPLAQGMVAALPGCMVERSLSGTGLHIWGRYPSPPPHRKRRDDLHCELYTEARFIAIGTDQTGEMLPRCDAFPQLVAQVFPPIERNEANVPTTGPRADWLGPTDDDELLRRAMQSRGTASVFGNKATFADLWLADADALRKAFPSSDPTDPYDRSAADMALAAHLAFWTGADVGRMERLMRRSALVRPKWDERDDYLVQRTIMGQCAIQRDVLKDKPVEALAVVEAPTPAPSAPPPLPGPVPAAAAPSAPAIAGPAEMRRVQGTTFLSPDQQIEIFKGCVYVQDEHKVLVPSGKLLTPDKFRARFGGYTWVMDNSNEKVSRNAWEAFTESQAIRAPRVDKTCFKPNLPFGSIIEHAGQSAVNTFIPPNVKRKPGDPSPFLRHLEKLLPDDTERAVVFYYLCCLVQRMGFKAQWALVLQGVEGNGKSFLSACAAEAVGRQYVFWPRANRVTSNFNSWLVGRVLYVIEEIMVHGRQEMMDELKVLITSSDGIEIEKKGVDQMSGEIVGNFLCNTNHKNAILKTRNDRRWCVIQTAQQAESDLFRDGITANYMPNLYSWAKSGGYAIVTDLLMSTSIPEDMDFTRGAHRAPKTRSYETVIADSRGPIEQEIVEAIERDEVGFRGGWVSSGFLDALLRKIGKDKAIAHNGRRAVLQSLGYDWHPALSDGRVNNPTMPDGAKVKLFVRLDRRDLLALRSPAEVSSAYASAQGVGAK